MRVSTLLCLAPWLLTGCDAFMCHPPPDGPLPAGLWGGAEWSISVQPDGSAWVEAPCARGPSLEPVAVSDGAFEFVARMTPSNVEPAAVPYEVTFRGEVCGDTMRGDVTSGGSNARFSVGLGEPSQMERCQTTSAPLPH